MAKPYPTIGSQPHNRNPTNAKPPPAQPRLTLSVPFTDIPNDPSSDAIYTFTVLRQGGNAGISDCDWAVVPSAGVPIPASYFGGAYPSGHIHIIASQGQQSVSFNVVAGADAAADQFADIVLSNFVGCKAGQLTTYQIKAPGGVVAADYIVSVDVPITVLTRDDTSDHAYTVNVTRTRIDNNYSGVCSVQLTALGSGATPFGAGDFTGGLLNQLVTFNAGETSKSYSIIVKAGADPANDLTGNISISAPSNCKVSPSAASVAVKIPKAVVIVTGGVLPPEYTDMPLDSMTAIPISTLPALTTQLNAMSGRPICKTSYIQLADDFDYGTAMYTISQSGYYDTVAGQKWPLIISGGKGPTLRSRNKKAHFRYLTVSGDCVCLMWHETTRPLDSQGPETYPYQGINAEAITVSGKDCFLLRCWLDCPRGVFAIGDVPNLTVAACDFYGVTATDPNTTAGGGGQIHLEIGAGTDPPRPTKALMHNNFMSQLANTNNGGIVFYTGNGRKGANGGTATSPVDINMRDCWFFNNCVMSMRAWLIYNKHATNVYRNKVYSVQPWNSVNPNGHAFHMVTTRGGNQLGMKVKYNIIGGGQRNGLQGWNGEFDFNRFDTLAGLELWIQENNTGGDFKALMGTRGWKFRGNKGNFDVVCGSARSGTFTYQGGLDNDQFEGNPGANFKFEDAAPSGWSYDGNAGASINFGADGWNTNRLQVKEGTGAFHDAVPIASVKRTATTALTPELTLPDELVAATTGVLAPTKLVWDGVGGGGSVTDPYRLTQDNFTLQFPSDNMATDFPNCSLTWLAGGGFECKAGLGNAIDVGKHACLNMWMKNPPPHDATTFTFYYTRLDNLAAADSDGVFTLFRERFKGLPAYGADPNGWAKASWRTDPNYPTAGSDLIYRERGLGYRNSFANRALTAPATMQFRLRTYNGIALDGGTQIFDTTGFTADNVSGGSTFDFPLNVKCKVEVIRNGTSLIGKRTRTDTGAVQEWDWTDNLIGTAGRGVDGWCGFGFFLGAWGRVEPVPGVAFCQ